ncbi:MAG TPA: hypothetical protein VN806_07440 [Caulobacteraceae bacterium]|nr:hypothetical protein [Caulobacteraceae bacterium]
MRHWSREGPPLYLAAAAYLGLRKPSASGADHLEGEDLVTFLAAFPAS